MRSQGFPFWMALNIPIVALVFGLGMSQWYRLDLYQANSTSAGATIIGENIEHITSFKHKAPIKNEMILEYRYSDTVGGVHETAVEVDPATWTSFKKGDILPIRFFNTHPDRSYINLPVERFNAAIRAMSILTAVSIVGLGMLFYLKRKMGMKK
jgi:hypothetical protein